MKEKGIFQPDQLPTPANNHMSASAGMVEGVGKSNSEQLKATIASGLVFLVKNKS